MDPGQQQQQLTQIHEVIATLANSGDSTPEPKALKKLKSLCRKGNDQIETAYRQLSAHLHKNHSQVRLSVLQIIEQLFDRSGRFRELLTEDFQQFLTLTVGLNDVDAPLPLPQRHAKLLCELALRCVNGWFNRFGKQYKQLALGYRFLRAKCKIDFGRINQQSLAAQQRERVRKEQIAEFRKQQIEKVKHEYKDLQVDINATLAEIASAADIIFSFDKAILNGKGEKVATQKAHEKNTEDDSDDDDENDDYKDDDRESNNDDIDDQKNEPSAQGSKPVANQDSTKDDFLAGCEGTGEVNQALTRDDVVQMLGLGNADYKLTVSVGKDGKVEMPDQVDLEPVLVTLHEGLQLLLKRYLPKVKDWIQTAQKCEDSNLLASLVSLKQRLTETDAKFTEVDFSSIEKEQQHRKSQATNDEDGESDDDMEDVEEKDGYEEFAAPVGVVRQPAVQPIEPNDVSTIRVAATSSRSKFNATEKSLMHPKANFLKGKEKLYEMAPVVPFGPDLEYWGKEDTVIKPQGMTSLHKFWRPKDHEEGEGATAKSLGLTQRTEYYQRPYEPVQHQCGAYKRTADDGTIVLCSRRDRKKCPFHGPIVPRDAKGDPVC